MERVVYILGAGFSAPLGIPVVRSFLPKAKDLRYFSEDYAHFEDVLRAVNGLAPVKGYLNSDLLDIEEVFSIIEMQRQLGASQPDVSKFIADVIKAYTPPMSEPPRSGHYSHLWGTVGIWALYARFGMALARVRFASHGQGAYTLDFLNDGPQYDVLTLNYDRALELPLDRLSHVSQTLGRSPLYVRPCREDSTTAFSQRFTIAKLHGDAYDETIVPPTFDKSVRDNVRADWEAAFRILSSANHVRVVGYSFPTTDTYFKYFLKAALSQTQHLKTIDVLTLDPDGSVQQRVQDVFTFKFTRFAEVNVQHYLSMVDDFRPLEKTHEHMMSSNP